MNPALVYRTARRPWTSRWVAPLRYLTFVPAALCAIYLIAPVVYFWTRLSWSNVGPVLGDARTGAALRTSIGTSTLSMIIMACFGVPLAYALARHQLPRPVSSLATLLVVMPLAFPPIISGIMLIVLFGPYSSLGSFLGDHGIVIVNTSLGIILAQVFVSAPFVVLTARAAFEAISPEFEAAAAIDGAGWWTAFSRITLPLASRGITVGLLLAWMRSLGEFGATIIVAYHPFALPVFTWVQLSAAGLANALPLVLLLLLVGLCASAIAVLTGAWQPTAV